MSSLEHIFYLPDTDVNAKDADNCTDLLEDTFRFINLTTYSVQCYVPFSFTWKIDRPLGLAMRLFCQSVPATLHLKLYYTHNFTPNTTFSHLQDINHVTRIGVK